MDALPNLEKPAWKRWLPQLPWRGASFSQKIAGLNFTQWCYLLAAVVAIGGLANETPEKDQQWLLVGAIAGVGLLRELWFLFQRLWDHRLGKGVIVILYATTANVSLAVSAMKISAIVGMEPTPFVFTLGFTTLLMLPYWLLIASVAFLALALLLLNLWLMLGILLRLVRIKVRLHWEDEHFVIVTMLMRVVMIPFVMSVLVAVMEPYTQQIGLFDEQLATLSQATEEDGTEETQLQVTVGRKTPQSNIEVEPVTPILNRLIASFIFWFETYPDSMCQKAPHQRSLIIDEDSMLVAQKADNEIGFEFDVAACIPRYVDTVASPVSEVETVPLQPDELDSETNE
ncbi:hypothetical protein LJ739_18280 [Aestuariibacter halophilus]|uniref:Uncharacterized protein n=1 Tax=Fluctibacter halophilus TaxID=226011 RepID=A0ABS8GE73_9ALTE|nr:hypothetical protein [Aestuariibacter halophilus]MCC2618210.1 hypothetical protein [Aestuariibacter halophilus]